MKGYKVIELNCPFCENKLIVEQKVTYKIGYSRSGSRYEMRNLWDTPSGFMKDKECLNCKKTDKEISKKWKASGLIRLKYLTKKYSNNESTKKIIRKSIPDREDSGFMEEDD